MYYSSHGAIVPWELSSGSTAPPLPSAAMLNRSYSGRGHGHVFGYQGFTAASSTGPTPTLPQITLQPQPQTVVVGSSATFTVAATGATGYQWRLDGVSISGATTASYTTGTLALVDSGHFYSAAVSNGAGTVISNSALLTVLDALAPTTTISVALDGGLERNLRLFAGDQLVIGVVVYAKDGDIEPIAVTTPRLVSYPSSVTLPVGAQFTVPDGPYYSGQRYRLVAEVYGVTTTLAFGRLEILGHTRSVGYDYGGPWGDSWN